MTRTILVGVLLFLVFAVAFAPASLMRRMVPAGSGIDLLDTRGTLWHGSGDVYFAGQPAGRLSWRFAAARVLRGRLAYRVALRGSDDRLNGQVELASGHAEAALAGHTGAAFANRWLMPYDIAISGQLELQDAQVQVPYDFGRAGGGASSGALTWSGGPIHYRLGGRAYSGNLPPLVAYLGKGLEAVVFPQGGQTPLMHVAILKNGFIRIGVTQLFTDMAGNPWPGSHADHDVVLQVEQQLF